jgi:hypothetical protein
MHSKVRSMLVRGTVRGILRGGKLVEEGAIQVSGRRTQDAEET